jgi:CspA family cold shock protein
MTTPLPNEFERGLPVPTGKVKWYDATKGFGFISRDDGGDVFVHSSSLPAGVAELSTGQKVEFGIAEGRRGETALAVRLMEAKPSVVTATRKPTDEMVVIVEDLIKLLDGVSTSLRRGRYPDRQVARKVGGVLRGVADQLEA